MHGTFKTQVIPAYTNGEVSPNELTEQQRLQARNQWAATHATELPAGVRAPILEVEYDVVALAGGRATVVAILDEVPEPSANDLLATQLLDAAEVWAGIQGEYQAKARYARAFNELWESSRRTANVFGPFTPSYLAEQAKEAAGVVYGLLNAVELLTDRDNRNQAAVALTALADKVDADATELGATSAFRFHRQDPRTVTAAA